MDNTTLFDALGFRWDRSTVPVPCHSIERVCFRFHKMLPDHDERHPHVPRD